MYFYIINILWYVKIIILLYENITNEYFLYKIKNYRFAYSIQTVGELISELYEKSKTMKKKIYIIKKYMVDKGI